MAIDIGKIEDRLDKAVVAGTAISMDFGGVKFQTMIELMEFARLMSVSGAAVPYHLRGNPGACLAICTRALRFGFDPFALAEHSFAMKKDVEITKSTEGGGRVTVKEPQETITYDSYVMRAVIEAHAPIEGRLKYTFAGDGDEMTCTVSAVPRGEKDAISITSPTLGERKKSIGTNKEGNLKGSPLWSSKPMQQLAYDTGRDFCRRYFPETLMGWYDKDEFDEHVRAETAENITPKPDIASRLRGATGRGFSKEHVEAQTAIEHKPGEAVPEAKKEPEAVVITDDAVLEKAGIVHIDPYTSPPAGPVPAGEPTKVVDDPPPKKKSKAPKAPESPLDRARRLLPMCRTREDVDNVLHSIGEELVDEADRAALKELGDAREKEF